MKVLIVYGTTEGQTRKIAGFVATQLMLQQHQVFTIDAPQADRTADPSDFDAVLIAASLHAGRYQLAVAEYIKRHLRTIDTRRNAFLSVSLSAASHDPEDVAGLNQCVTAFLRETGWMPGTVHHVAGAFRYTEYDFLKGWAMRYIAYRKGAPTDTRRDYELTDWDDVERFAKTFASPVTDVQRGPSSSAPGGRAM